MPAHPDQPKQLKTFAQLLEKMQGLGSTWNRLVAWAAKTENSCEKLRKYMFFTIKVVIIKPLKLCENFAKSL